MRYGAIVFALLLLLTTSVLAASSQGEYPTPGVSTVPSGYGTGPSTTTTSQMYAVPSSGMMMQMSSITVDDRYAYVVRGSDLYKFDKNNFQLVSRTPLPAVSVPSGVGAGPSGQMAPMISSAVTVDNRYAYVVRGNELLKFDKNNFQLISRTLLPGVVSPGIATVPSGVATVPPGVATVPPNVQMAPVVPLPGGTGAGPGPGVTTYRLPGTGVITTVQPSTSRTLQTLQSASGAAFDQAFLVGITNHYAGSIAIGQLSDDIASHRDLQKFGESYARDRGRENETFAKWARDWYGLNLNPTIPSEDVTITSQMRGLSGNDADIALLNNLYYQISQAQQMTLLAREKAQRPELRETAVKMLDQQNKEMAWVATRLASWYGLQPLSYVR